ncbi:hypothetical protein ACNPKZ_00285 [Shewanella algae]|uniref:hypothetical protein n=1 Tax=Shewanella algae TaxID=38313 RepID=UPI003AAA6692
MSRRNAVKIQTLIAESSGYHFKSTSDDSSYVIATKHGLCHNASECEPYNEGDPVCCKTCKIELQVSTITLSKKGSLKLTPSKVYSFPNNDIAVIQVEENSSTPLTIGKLEDGKGEFSVFGFKSDSTSSSRLLLNNPEIDDDECYYNIESNPTTELIEKSKDLVGMSGSIVIDRSNSDIPIVYSVITTNEESNDILGEQLESINFEEMHTFFGSNIFCSKPYKINLDTSFKGHFKNISNQSINKNINVSILIPNIKGIPFFNLTPIARALTNEFELILGDNRENKSLLTISALRVLEQKKALQPAYKLLASRIVEAIMDAPHIYSTYIDHAYYHHVHMLNNSKDDAEFIVASYGGEGELGIQINHTLSNMLKELNSYSFNASLIAERSFLDVKYTQQECEMLYKILFGNENEMIKNISMMHCINLQSYDISKTTDIETQIADIVSQEIDKIDPTIIESIHHEININLYILPMNKSDELTELVGELLK